MKEKRQLISKIKRLREDVHKLELRVIVLKAMLQAGETELEKKKNTVEVQEGATSIIEGDSVPLIAGE